MEMPSYEEMAVGVALPSRAQNREAASGLGLTEQEPSGTEWGFVLQARQQVGRSNASSKSAVSQRFTLHPPPGVTES